MAHLPVVSRFRGIGTAGAVDTSPRRSHNHRSAGRVRSRERLEHDRLLGAHATGREIASSHGHELKVADRNSHHLELRARVDERRLLPLRRSARLVVHEVVAPQDVDAVHDDVSRGSMPERTIDQGPGKGDGHLRQILQITDV